MYDGPIDLFVRDSSLAVMRASSTTGELPYQLQSFMLDYRLDVLYELQTPGGKSLIKAGIPIHE